MNDRNTDRRGFLRTAGAVGAFTILKPQRGARQRRQFGGARGVAGVRPPRLDRCQQHRAIHRRAHCGAGRPLPGPARSGQAALRQSSGGEGIRRRGADLRGTEIRPADLRIERGGCRGDRHAGVFPSRAPGRGGDGGKARLSARNRWRWTWRGRSACWRSARRRQGG